MALEFTFKEKYGMADLLEIMAMLRGEGGCPWDREQTHGSIRKNFIEETYEVIEAIDAQDPDMLREELGDVLMQVVFHAQIEAEAGGFTFEDVCDELCQKLIVRHPHVFGNVVAETSEAVLRNWEDIKQRQKGQTTVVETLESVPRQLPALMRSAKVQHRAAKVGFDYPDVQGAMGDLESELDELKTAVCEGDGQHQREELGDLLFAAVNVARFLDLDPEESLTRSCEKFIRRFGRVELLAEEEEICLAKCSIDELNALWGRAKAQLRQDP